MKGLETKKKFIELRAKGVSFDKIAKELSISKQTLIKWSKEMEIEISNLKAIELEVLQEQYYIAKEQRIKLFGKHMEAIVAELSKRNLSDIPTDKLLELMIKLSNSLKNEEIIPTFKRKVDNSEFFNELMNDIISWKA